MISSSAQKFNKIMLILLTIFIIPIILAYLFYQYHGTFKLETTNYGKFVPPIKTLSPLNLNYFANPSKKNKTLAKNPWTLLYISSISCEKDCLNNLKKMNTVHQATGKYFYNIKELIILPSNLPKLELAKLHKQYPYLDIATTKTKQINLMDINTKHHLLNNFFITDPNQRLVLYYPAHAQGNGILRDLQHLLRINNE